MQSLSCMFSAATLFLVLCLQLGINDGQETERVRKPLLFDLDVPEKANINEDVAVTLSIQTEYKECMVIKSYLQSNVEMDGSFNYKQTRCLCNDRPIIFFWDFTARQTAKIKVVVEITKEKGICPNDVAVVPIYGDQYYTYRTLSVN